jgi:hypothetical protein
MAMFAPVPGIRRYDRLQGLQIAVPELSHVRALRCGRHVWQGGRLAASRIEPKGLPLCAAGAATSPGTMGSCRTGP